MVAGREEGELLFCLARFWGQVRRLRDVWGDLGRDKQRLPGFAALVAGLKEGP